MIVLVFDSDICHLVSVELEFLCLLHGVVGAACTFLFGFDYSGADVLDFDCGTEVLLLFLDQAVELVAHLDVLAGPLH